jgi:hypothetical protein
LVKKTNGRIEAPASPEGAAALASDALLSSWARSELDLTMLTREQQLLFAVAAVREQVGSGGFAGYFSSSANVLEPITPEALRIIGEAWAVAFEEAEAVADGLGRDGGAMAESSELAAIDRRFEALESETSANAILDAWVGWNRDDIFQSKRLFGLL